MFSGIFQVVTFFGFHSFLQLNVWKRCFFVERGNYDSETDEENNGLIHATAKKEFCLIVEMMMKVGAIVTWRKMLFLKV